MQQCKRFCILYDIATNCSCFHPLYYDVGKGIDVLKPCNLASAGLNYSLKSILICILCLDVECMEEVFKQIKSDAGHCDCQPACKEIDYETTLSASVWPSNYYRESIFLD